MKPDFTAGEKIALSIVFSFLCAFLLSYLAFFLRSVMLVQLSAFPFGEGPAHCLQYLVHLAYFVVFLLYALFVKRDRQYIFVFHKGSAAKNIRYALIGIFIGFGMMGMCVLAAWLHSDLVIRQSAGIDLPVMIFAIPCVLIQSSAEELVSRAFLFGKMTGADLPLLPAVFVSAFFFAYSHASNPGFGLTAFACLFASGVFYALCYHASGSIWLVSGIHMAWNYTQDFLLGLPVSGRISPVSLCQTEIQNSGFFYDEKFGMEGSRMAVLINLLACGILLAILSKKRKGDPKK